MRLEHFRKDRAGNEKTIGCFAMGKEEAEIIADLVSKSVRYTPMTPETHITVNRLRTIRYNLKKALDNWKLEDK